VETDTTPGFQPLGFAGGLYDPDTRLVRFGARDYDPAIGRWRAKDPSGFAGGTNLYAYADNDPVNLVDLTGEHPVVFLMLAGAMEGIITDGLFQMTVGGKRWGCLDGQELAMAAIMGALSGGLGAPAASGGTSSSTYVYQLVDDLGEPVYYGISKNPMIRLGQHARRPEGPFRGMQIISDALALPQARSLETSLIQQARAEGRLIYNAAGSSISHAAPIATPPTILPIETILNPRLYPR
jgi:RHS repeat-associated protein